VVHAVVKTAPAGGPLSLRTIDQAHSWTLDATAVQKKQIRFYVRANLKQKLNTL
jgi:hypothetical protein